MLLLMLLLVFSLFIFKNSLYFTMALLLISISTLSFMALNTYISTLTAFMLVIVYVGAMMILIGYICAISPNIIVEPDYSYMFSFILMSIIFMIMNKTQSLSFNISTFTLVDFFYSFYGLFLFMTLVLMLFITLLMVTSQYSVPRGPFRSINS